MTQDLLTLNYLISYLLLIFNPVPTHLHYFSQTAFLSRSTIVYVTKSKRIFSEVILLGFWVAFG